MGKKLKHQRSLFCALACATLVIALTPEYEGEPIIAKAATSYTVSKMTAPTDYTPTQIVNGDFSIKPWHDYYYGGTLYTQSSSSYPANNTNVDSLVYNSSGWNTSEKQIYRDTVFEWITYNNTSNSAFNILEARKNNTTNLYEPYTTAKTITDPIVAGTNIGCVEMNANVPSVFYQDLSTHGGDIIRWNLDHAVRDENCNSKKTPKTQQMHVEVGKTPTSGGVVVQASGTDSKITENKATYQADSTNPVVNSGNTYGYGKYDELKTLKLDRDEDNTKWFTATGVYVVPKTDQTLTRFAFISDVANAYGNLLDNINFSTIIGNLKAYKDEQGKVIVTGYWGDTTRDKQLMIKVGSTEIGINMNSCLDGDYHYFKAEVTSDDIKNATTMSVYHEDYEDATTDVSIVHPHTWQFTAQNGKLSAYCTDSETALGNCKYQGSSNAVSVTISASNKQYDGNAYSGASLSDTNAWTNSGMNTPTIYYESQDGTTYTQTTVAPTDAGSYYAEIKGTNKDSSVATAKAAFTISKKSITASDITIANIADQKYTGSKITPALTITLKSGSKTLELNKDYTVTYSNNTNVGTATASITFVNNYSGTASKTFQIVAVPTTDIKVTLPQDTFTFDGKAHEPVPTVEYLSGGSYKTVSKSNYTVSYNNCTKAGTGTVTVTFSNSNYAGPIVKQITINEANASNLTINLEKTSYTYTGTAITPEVTSVKLGDYTVPTSDYTVSYSDNTNVGTSAKATVTMKSGTSITGSKSQTFTITAKDGSSTLNAGFKNGDTYTYTGNNITPEVEIKDGDYTLVLNKDYTVSYSSNKNPGTGKATITYTGNYSGTKELDFTINKADASSLTVALNDTSFTYTGGEIKPKVTSVKLGDYTVPTSDYSVSYSDNIDVTDNAKVKITLNETYFSNSKTVTFKITQKDISTSVTPVFPDGTTFTYTGNPITPSFSLKDGDKDLELNKDYTFEYEDNTNPGKGKIKITFKGDYKGEKTLEFTINKANASNLTVNLSSTSETYTGSEIKPTVTSVYLGEKLIDSSLYDVSWSNNINVTDTANVIVTMKEGAPIEGSKTTNFAITSKEASESSVVFSFNNGTDYTYTGKPITPAFKLTDTDLGYDLVEGTDYTVVYDKNTEAGKGVVKITFINNYSGSREVEFNINKASASALTINLEHTKYDYTGSAIEPVVTSVYLGDYLVPKDQYTISYGNNVSASTTAMVTIKMVGTSSIKGSTSTYFEIEQKNIGSSAEVTFNNGDEYTYTGFDITPTIVVKDGDTTLELNKDYKLTYTDNKNPGTGHIKIEFIGDYSGEKTVDFTIKKAQASALNVTLEDTSFEFTGYDIEPSVTSVKLGNYTVPSSMYDISYESNKNVGTSAKVIIKMKDGAPIEGSTSTYFEIYKKDASDTVYYEFVDGDEYTYTGFDITPEIYLEDNGVELVLNEDYTIQYLDNKEPGKGKVKITFIKNLEGEKTLEFTIKKANASNLTVELANTSYEFTGKNIEPVVTSVKLGDYPVPDNQYDISYSNNKDVTDAANVTVTMKDGAPITGSKTVNFSITKKDVSTSITASLTNGDEYTYTGKDIVPPFELFDGDYKLVEGTDFTVVYEDNKIPGKGKIKITFINNYKGEKTLEFTIKEANAEDLTVALDCYSFEYSGLEKQPNVISIKLGDVDIDSSLYTVSYTNNINASTSAHVVITMNAGAHILGSKVVDFEIYGKDITDDVLIYPIADYTFTGSKATPHTTVMYGLITLTEGVDYLISSTDINVGNATATFTFIGNYANTDNKEALFRIVPAIVNENDLTISAIAPHTYDGLPYEPKPSISYGILSLTEGIDYTLTYQNNINAPGGTVTITFKGNYAGSNPIVKAFVINPKVVSDPKTELSFDPSIDPLDDQDFTGYPIHPEIKIKDGDKPLKEGEDFIIVCDDIDVGPAELKIQFIGNYEGTPEIPVPFNIVPKEFDIVMPPYEYTGDPIVPHPIVRDGDKILEEGVDYIVIPDDDPTNSGPHELTIKFINEYQHQPDEKTTLNIIPKKLQNAEVTMASEVTYTGEEIKPEVTIKDGDTTLVLNEDYVVLYSNNIKPGTGHANIIFIGNYSINSPINKDFTIKPKVIQNPKDYFNFDPSIDPMDDQDFTGNPIKPDLIIKDGDKPLKEGEDYIIIPSEDIGPGPGEIIIQFIGPYEGTPELEIPFEIVPKDFDITVPPYEYTGDPIVPHPIVRDGDKILEEDVDYIVIPDDDSNAGEHELIIRFINEYEHQPEEKANYIITPKQSDELNIEMPLENIVYNGDDVTPNLTVNDGDKPLEEGKDYIVIYENNDGPGLATATVVFIGNYANNPSLTADYYIKATQLDNRDSESDTPEVILIWEEGFEEGITLSVELKANTQTTEEGNNFAWAFGRFYTLYGGYEIKLYRNGEEIQPSDLKEGTILTLKLKIPDEIKDFDIKLVHIHSDTDISGVVPGDAPGIGTYIIDEEGYIVTQISKLSEFSIVYQQPCFAHWILLAIAVLDIVLLLGLLILNKKPNKLLGAVATSWLIIMTAVAGIFSHCTFCYILLGINALLVAGNVVFFLLFKGKDDGSNEKTIIKTEIIREVKAEEKHAEETEEDKKLKEIFGEQKDVDMEKIFANDKNVKRFSDMSGAIFGDKKEEPVEEKPEEVPAQEEQVEEVSLKESIAQAKAVISEITLSKALICKFLSETYGERVEINTRPSWTSTGLPLGDTHYTMINGQRKCFIYVYEFDGKCFAILRSDDEVAKVLKDNGHKFMRSAFPKTRDYARWYTLLFDASFNNNDEALESLKFVIDKLLGFKSVEVPVHVEGVKEAPVTEEKPEEPVEEVSLKESIAQAKALVSEITLSKASICKWLADTYGYQVEINTRPSWTSTGLPLGDTHYAVLNGQRKCFIYVYEFDGKCFAILRSDDDVAKVMKNNGHKFMRSAFPKTRDYAKWYTFLFDSSFNNNDEVYESLKYVIDKLLGEKIVEEPVHVEPVNEQPAEQVSLKESIEQAKAVVSEITLNKEKVCKWLSENYGDQVEINTRPAWTSTGLPLGDTHYAMINGQRKCFIYVYEFGTKCFAILRSDDEVAKVMRENGHKFIPSAFPKTRDYAKWYTFLFDGSFANNDEVLESLRFIIDRLLGKKEDVKNLTLKESIKEAKSYSTVLNVNKQLVSLYLRNTYGHTVEVNTRECMTSTGLPLADTHYIYNGKEKKCFIYVYELDGKTFFIVRSNDEVANEIKADKHKMMRSDFPKTRDYAKWYTMIIDDSYKSNDDVFHALDKVINGLLADK